MKRTILLLKLLIVLLISVAMSAAHRSGKLNVFEGYWSDIQRSITWTIESRVLDVASAPLRVFAFPIDGASIRDFAKEGVSWPFPRSLYAQAVKRLESLGVRAVAFDVFFSQHDTAPGLDEFVDTLASSSVKVVLAATLEDAGASLQSVKTVEDDDDDEEYGFQKTRRIITLPHSRLREKAWGIGLINSELNINYDRIFRRQPPAYFHEGRWFPNLGVALVQATRDKTGAIELATGQMRLLDGKTVPLEPVVASQSYIGAEWAAEPRWRNHGGSIDQGCGRYFFSNFYNLVKGVNLWSTEKLKDAVV
ncbi:MAG TPA: CHASE2 domain-containing protein, partial [Candidatus Ozemobacteraceae bacterium]|nr:CHASE2 domain-containing protein [Candidatus Ozemobacteraceae bacterium]